MLLDHLKSAVALQRATKIGDRYESNQKLEKTAKQIGLFPSVQLTDADFRVLDQVTSYLNGIG